MKRVSRRVWKSWIFWTVWLELKDFGYVLCAIWLKDTKTTCWAQSKHTFIWFMLPLVPYSRFPLHQNSLTILLISPKQPPINIPIRSRLQFWIHILNTPFEIVFKKQNKLISKLFHQIAYQFLGIKCRIISWTHWTPQIGNIQNMLTLNKCHCEIDRFFPLNCLVHRN